MKQRGLYMASGLFALALAAGLFVLSAEPAYACSISPGDGADWGNWDIWFDWSFN